ncbi:hypothetical protein C496_17112 [Natronorubrum tibetense GA33]|uniref:DUF8048 domain-containing protein n=1 Tax=Natronorubrum tibetense GA33 TaxID=1114856 RepID=L9VQ43_9EURY|nr:hypothetical protein C496_17112 [Natronorubrum tibetense GA33]
MISSRNISANPSTTLRSTRPSPVANFAVLARTQLSGRQFALEGLTEKGEVVYQSNDETLLWLDAGFWSDMRGRHHLEPDEGRAAREVHRRLIESIDGDVSYYNRERDPFVLIERFDPYD